MDITTMTARFTPLSDVRAQLGESPVWSPADNAIWWVDISGNNLLRTDLTGATKTWSTPETPGFVQCVGGDVYVGMQTGIFQFDPETAKFDKHVAMNMPNQRFNDACTDARGRIWAGTMDLGNQGVNGALYLFDPVARTLDPKFSGFRTINGLAWDKPRQRLFFSDSHPDVQTVWTCKVSPTGQVSERAEFARFHNLNGRPDGATLDSKGNYWIAGVGGAELYRFTPNGTAVTQYHVPVKSPTKPAFIDQPETAMVLTSFVDETLGGRLMVWKNPPISDL